MPYHSCDVAHGKPASCGYAALTIKRMIFTLVSKPAMSIHFLSSFVRLLSAATQYDWRPRLLHAYSGFLTIFCCEACNLWLSYLILFMMHECISKVAFANSRPAKGSASDFRTFFFGAF